MDVTKEYIAGKTEFTVNIALVVQGVVEPGVVLAPARENFCLAAKSMDLGRGLVEGTSRSNLIRA